MSLTLATLTIAETQDVIAARVVAALRARGLPVDSWMPVASGGVELTAVNMLAGTIGQLASAKVAAAARGRFIDMAEGDLLTYLARHYYGLDRSPATSTVQNIRLTAVAAAPAIDLAAGDLWVAAQNGNRYVSIEDVSLVPGRSASVRCQAENPGAAYADPEGTVTTMVVAPAGVSCVNARPSDYLPPHLNGFSTGTIQVQGQDDDHIAPPVNAVVRIRIDQSGSIGSGAFSYQFDDQNWQPVTPIQEVFFAPNEDTWFIAGNRIIFKNGGGVPSFIAGDLFTFYRGEAVLQHGADAWSDPLLRMLCRAKWQSLSAIPTDGSLTLMAFLASPEIRKILIDADPEVPGSTRITIASGSGPASGAAQVAVSDFIEARLQGFKGLPAPGGALAGIARSPEETISVRSVGAVPITASATVYVPKAKLVATQQAADLAWIAYLDSVDIGGAVVLAKLEEIVLDAGAANVDFVLLNGVAANVQLGATQVAVPADGTSLVTSLSWAPI